MTFWRCVPNLCPILSLILACRKSFSSKYKIWDWQCPFRLNVGDKLKFWAPVNFSGWKLQLLMDKLQLPLLFQLFKPTTPMALSVELIMLLLFWVYFFFVRVLYVFYSDGSRNYWTNFVWIFGGPYDNFTASYLCCFCCLLSMSGGHFWFKMPMLTWFWCYTVELIEQFFFCKLADVKRD